MALSQCLALRGQSEFKAFLPSDRAQPGLPRHAAALIYLLSKGSFPERPFSCTLPSSAAPPGELCHLATAVGWAAHGMSGFDAEKARTVLRVPERFAVEIAIALGARAMAGPASSSLITVHRSRAERI